MSLKPMGLKNVQGIMSVYMTPQNQKIPLPEEIAFLVKEASDALYKANFEIIDKGGRLYISSMWRPPEDQFRRWYEWSTGKKTSYSPPPSYSMHEYGRAIDIDTRLSQTKIPHEDLRLILASNGWMSLVPVGTPGDWHYEYRSPELQTVLAASGYAQMVKLAAEKSKYKSTKYSCIDYTVEKIPDTWK